MTDHQHQWRTDGMHLNEFCGICFVSKPVTDGTEGGPMPTIRKVVERARAKAPPP